MALPFIDKVENLSCHEALGVIRSLTRKVRVQFDKSEITLVRDYNVLSEALKVLDLQGVVAGQKLGDFRNRDERFAPLILTNRDPSIVDNDPCWVDVICRYDHMIDGPNQTLRNPTYGVLFGKGKTSIVEKSTNFYYPFGIRDPSDLDKGKQQIVVSHTYPSHETGIAASPHDPDYPRNIVQSGEINIPYPQSTYSVEGIFPTNNPAALSYAIVASINVNRWQGQPPLTWICSECRWEVNDPSNRQGLGAGIARTPTYRMGFEFQYNSDTWDPAVVFIDQRTSRPPAGVLIATDVAGLDVPAKFGGPGPERVRRMAVHPNGKQVPAGLWKVPALRRIDFDAFFGAIFEGINPPAVV
jgi:hypothetical protein